MAILAAVGVFVVSAALQDDYAVCAALHHPGEPLVGKRTFAELALIGRYLYLLRLICKVAGKPAEILAVVFIVSYPEILPAAEQPEVEDDIIRRAATDVVILGNDREDLFGFPCAE